LLAWRRCYAYGFVREIFLRPFHNDGGLTAARIPSPDGVTDETPLRLDTAASLAFPDGSVTGDTLRREARKGRLVIEHIGGKYFTTLGAIKK
jgi:hypothetical protein